MKKFAIIGAAGYVAPKHFQAIKNTKNNLVAALDKHDSVGILDSYFPEAAFFTEFERFDRHLEKLKRQGEKVDFVSVCSPNYLHDAHCRFGLRYGADVICEKPLVLNPWNVEALQEMEQETGRKVFTILQLRLHPNVIALKNYIAETSLPEGKKWQVNLDYITARGNWYFASWKNDISKSGGISTNIGIHFLDMLIWVFGKPQNVNLTQKTAETEAGYFEFEKAEINWKLSISQNNLPESVKNAGKRTYRSLKIDGKEWEFSDGFTDLHTQSYEQILAGNGFGIGEALAGIELAHRIRNF